MMVIMKKYVALFIFVSVLSIFLFVFSQSFFQYNDGGLNNKVEDPHIFLITLDSVRSDHLQCYGYYRNTAPNICGLAEDSVLFKEAWPGGPTTPFSIPSLMLSEYSIMHGVTGFDQEILAHSETIFDVLDDNYYTGFVTDFNAIPSFFPEED